MVASIVVERGVIQGHPLSPPLFLWEIDTLITRRLINAPLPPANMEPELARAEHGMGLCMHVHTYVCMYVWLYVCK